MVGVVTRPIDYPFSIAVVLAFHDDDANVADTMLTRLTLANSIYVVTYTLTVHLRKARSRCHAARWHTARQALHHLPRA